MTGLQFMQIGKLVGVQKVNIALPAQKAIDPPITINGVVRDNDGNPLPGVTVNVRGKSRSVVTNDAGEFTLTVDRGDILVVSYVGYTTQEIPAESSSLTIQMIPGDKALDEVVVTTALGIKKEKIRTTYAMQEVKGTAMEKAREPNVISNLTGKVAGLSIQNKSTLFENPEFTLRGGSTLVVIDGVPASTDFWNINADDIDNVNVLKGTAATALYGSLGINGAIMITTKKGKAGKNGVEVSFNSSNQFQAGYIVLPEAQTTYGMGWAGQYAFKDGRGGGLYDDYGYVYGPKLNQPDPNTASGFVELPQWNSPIDPATGERVPLPWITRSESNLKKFLRNQLLTTNNISIAGKHENGDYRISLTHLYQKGQVPNTHVNSTTLSMAGSLKLSEKLKVEATLSYNKQYSPNYPVTGYGPNNFFYNVLLWLGPEVDINDMKNYWVEGREGIEQKTYNYTWYNNPWFLAMERLRNYQRDAIVAQANAVYNFNDDLSFMVRSGATVNNTTRTIKTPWSYIDYDASKAPNGNYEIWKQDQLRIVSDAMLTYKKNFSSDLNLIVSAGASSRFDHIDENQSNTNGLSVPEVYNLSNSINPIVSTNVIREKQVNSVLGYAELGWKNQIFLNLSGRNDWSSALQKPNNSFFYPSASVGVVASEMVKLPSFFSFLKFRGSWANISTDIISIGDEVLAEYATLPVYLNGVRWNGQSSLNLPGRLISPNIRPNKTISQEYGTEMRFVNNRIGLDFTYYSYDDKDFVVAVPISNAAGYEQLIVNGDRVNRRGIELMLTGSPVRGRDFKWDVAINYSRHRSIQKEFYGGDSIRNLVEVGGRTDVLSGYKWDRSPDGDVVYLDGIPQYVNALTKLGYENPDWEFGITNSFSYKNLTLAFQFDGRIGGQLINGVEAKMYEGGMHKATVNQFRDDAYNGVASYVGDGVVATSGSVEYDAFGRLVSDSRKFAPNGTKVNYIDWVFASYTNGIQDAVLYKRSFVKLREVIITYNLGPRLMSKLPFKAANLSVVGRNLLLFTDVPFMDPDGYNDLTLAEPSYRNIGVNLNLKF
jgi:TonB-linked SusC/RagA family outer membrane protein